MKAAGVSAAALGTTGALGAETNVKEYSDVPLALATQFPKLALITDYSPRKLALPPRSGTYHRVIVLRNFGRLERTDLFLLTAFFASTFRAA